MSTSTNDHNPGGPGDNRALLFLLSCVALTAAGMVFALRATVMKDFETAFALNAESVGAAVGAAFLAFAIAVLLGSPLCDYVGMGRLLGLACLLHIGGTVITIFTARLTGLLPAYHILWIGMFTVGLAHGLVEAVINPLIATLYADDKTHKLNVLHAWWPGGLIIGGLIGFALQKAGMTWQVRLSVVFIPAVIYGSLIMMAKFPPTERMAAGVPARDMLREAFRPLFIAWFCCMWLTAATELGPNQWVEAMLRTLGFSGILVLVYVSALMFVLRHFAGTFAHKLSPVGLMWMSSLLAGIGLLMLSAARSPVPALVAATVWGVGICYMWPTMLGVASERCPRGGALLLGLLGTAGNLSIYFVLPAMGRIYDFYTQKALPAGLNLQELIKQAAAPSAQATLEAARVQAAPYAYQYVAAVTVVLIIVFGVIWLRDKAAGGYKAVKLDTTGTAA